MERQGKREFGVEEAMFRKWICVENTRNIFKTCYPNLTDCEEEIMFEFERIYIYVSISCTDGSGDDSGVYLT